MGGLPYFSPWFGSKSEAGQGRGVWVPWQALSSPPACTRCRRPERRSLQIVVRDGLDLVGCEKSSRGCVRKSRRHKKKTWMMMSFFRIFIAYSSSVPFLSASITFRREFYNHKKVQLVTQNTSALLMSNWSTLQIILRSLHFFFSLLVYLAKGSFS